MACRIRTLNDGAEHDNIFCVDGFNFACGKFNIKNFPVSTGVDLYSDNFAQDFKMLDGNIEMCYWCNEKVRHFDWETTKNPQLQDWLANPDEI